MNYKKILLISGSVIFLGVILFFGSNFLEKVPQASLSEITQNKVLYIINKGNGEINEYQIEISQDSTVFSLLETLSQREKFELSSTFYKGMGVFVETIGTVKNGTEGKYWQYFINDKLGEVAADKKTIKEGDKIEWRFEVPPDF
ncbi:MAG: hypothetical protein AUK07_01660 [Parcubacteria group bacterium CG2_30_36_21]|uniref:Transcobalamin-like C-terminal domain-containing protein n=3 Tax=Candidatus Gribaldobacteria TaxID=2798536 RepID=A0A2M7VJQ9_9BACT|nr:MAG: hypothetical protein AUK07_01660 [Parcubacteria group bacterium CG2_30_36_21]PIR90918.1 MAG: hypothetical protein COU02_01685 [bacterium (Candidatus Gribaldobacteria) CG10_big_fil_rev_8_21_14_0_10_37_46]PIV14142.1 MAG: hypothetical protein COS44_00540 [bacterium (Candidatus Gribaldobacteria) CG03_land_8_20_14_0_80_36_40]PJA01986.1 MAG: hypothetical protein COX73_03150 [bacterium (Candidatus Gribaldobacteria) CG_4_10_14_0_2_um_filter_36_18]